MDSQIPEQTNDPTAAISPNIVYLTAPSDNLKFGSIPSPRNEITQERIVQQWARTSR
jgi:hypothetical protein